VKAADEIYLTLIAPIEDRMMRTVSRIVRDPEETADAFQTALMRVWKNLKKIHRHPNPHGYILRICINASYDQLRRRSRLRKREVSFESTNALDREAAQSAEIREEETAGALTGALSRLPRKQAQAVVMRALEEESFQTIGQTLGCREATARSHYSKGKARLRQLLASQNPIGAKETNQ
jgi:RNA polymerase sigma factor (sigma-70 family)